MSSQESLRAPVNTRFISDVAETIAPHLQEFDEIATSPAIQEFAAFESRYRGITQQTQVMDIGLNFMDFDPLADSFSAEEVGEALDAAHRRVDTFVEIVVESYCKQKRQPVPDQGDMQATGTVLSRVLAGGMEKLFDLTVRPFDQDKQPEAYSEVIEQHTYLPSTLLMLGARLKSAAFYEEVSEGVLETTVAQEEIDQSIDTALQEACTRIIRNEKTPLPKKKGEISEYIFASSMNCLRALYHQGKDQGFQRTIMTQLYYAMRPDYDSLVDGGGMFDEGIMRVAQDEWFENTSRILNKTIGATMERPEPEKLRQLLLKVEAAAVKFMELPVEQSNQAMFRMFHKIYSAHAARHFVDGIASGRMKYSEIVRAMMHLRQQPLSGYELPDTTTDIDKIWVAWEMLPQGLAEAGEHDRPPASLTNPKEPREREIDWLRIASLVSYGRQWGEASFARTKIPGLPEDKQYYAVILPEVLPDGTVLEHAVADHPEQGNGLYIWRAERAYLRDPNDKNRDLTWREVLAHKRMVARLLGARCFYHTKNMELSVLDYLTAPTEKLVGQRRYAMGRGATRMARLAHDLDFGD